MFDAFFLSKRSADSSKLIHTLEKDPILETRFFSQGFINVNTLQAATDYVAENYHTGEPEAEEAIKHLIRERQQRRSKILTNRLGQEKKTITIPATSTHPSRSVPVSDGSQPQPAKPLTIDADPSAGPDASPEEKADDLTKPVEDVASSRQQKLLNSIKALQVAISEVAKDMYQTALLQEHSDKVVSKCIDAISAAQSEQTADTVKTMASPLIGVA